MSVYRAVSGIWSDLKHDKGVAVVEEYEELEDEEPANKFNYGFNFAVAEDEREKELWPLHKIICDKIKAGEVEMNDDYEVLVLAGQLPPPRGCVVKYGEIYDIEQARQTWKGKIRARVNELYSGYYIEKAERNPVFKKNWRRSINNLLAAEDREDFLDVLIPEVENA
jgi:hypothetical protein